VTAPRPLSRPALEADGLLAPPAPVRIVHLGLGAFHRAHQAWYTARADVAGEWGIAAFTGRDATQAEILGAQDGLYTLIERGPDGDVVEVVPSIVETHPGADLTRLRELLVDPRTAIVTLTVTEAGYRLRPGGTIDLQDAAIAADLHALRAAVPAGIDAALVAARPTAAPTRLLAGLIARHRAGGAPIAVVSCDNLPDNGRIVARAMRALAAELPATALHGFGEWMAASVSFVSTSVDRITPRSNGEAVDAARGAGWIDAAPVVTEPFHDWVLAGEFPAGRPPWELAGARFVADIDPWERRKLWLLNGAHTILAAAGLRRGHTTVDEAISDPECRELVEAFWAEAVALLPEGIEHVIYRRDLEERFRNPRIRHELAQIAEGMDLKVSVRIAAIAEERRRRGWSASGSAAALAEWIEWTPEHRAAVAGAEHEGTRVVRAMARASEALAADSAFLDDVRAAHSTLTRSLPLARSTHAQDTPEEGLS